jgi:lipopolysaccharide/colanic/teichoic acid biosynthesis glycosyltransferase
MSFFSNIFNKFFGRSGQAFNGIHSPEEFRLILERERARADRSGDKFSLVVFDFGNTNNGNGSSLAVEHLTRILFQRVRLTDTVGWFDDKSIGTVLFGTTGEGAWKFADDVRKKANAIASQFSYRVYSYPTEGTADEKEVSGQPRRQEVSRQYGQVSFEGFFIRNPAPSRRYVSPMPLKSAVPFRRSQKPVENGEALFARPMPLWKRSIDIVGAGFGLILLTPLMAVVSVAIKLTSPGPVIFRQNRAGLGGGPFVLYKFRTMVADAEARKKDLMVLNEQDGPAFKITNDPRMTPIGSLLRKTSIDELPQLWNVLKGDMSLVGPRPLPCDESDECDPWQRKRLDVTPGITCIWQVRGRSTVSFSEWCRMDIQYIRNAKLFHDIKILMQTLPSVLLRKGAR